jgi:hypothetical protein
MCLKQNWSFYILMLGIVAQALPRLIIKAFSDFVGQV